MIQIKLSIAFVLAAAAIAPVFAQPILGRGHSNHVLSNASPSVRREYTDELEVRREGHGGNGHGHHGRGFRKSRHQAIPDTNAGAGPQDTQPEPPQSRREYIDELEVRHEGHGGNGHGHHGRGFKKSRHSRHEATDTNAGAGPQDTQPEPPQSRREYVDEFEARGDSTGQPASQEKSLLSEDSKLRKQHESLVGQNSQLEKTDKHLKLTDGNLFSKKHSLVAKNEGLRNTNQKLGAKGQLLGKNDKTLEMKGKALDRKNGYLSKKGDTIAKQDKAKAPVARASTKKPIVAREYAEFDDMVQRDFEDVEFEARDFDDELYLD